MAMTQKRKILTAMLFALAPLCGWLATPNIAEACYGGCQLFDGHMHCTFADTGTNSCWVNPVHGEHCEFFGGACP